jgi:hypothetical protein
MSQFNILLFVKFKSIIGVVILCTFVMIAREIAVLTELEKWVFAIWV